MNCKYKHNECKRCYCSNCDLVAVVDDNCHRQMMSVPKYVPMEKGLYRLSVQVWIKCPCLHGLYLLQKRSPNVGYNPNMWSPLTGGVKADEDVVTTIHREAKEELGISLTNLKFIDRCKRDEYFEEVWYAELIPEYSDTEYPGVKFALQKEEVDAIIFVDNLGIKQYFDEGTLADNSYFKTHILELI